MSVATRETYPDTIPTGEMARWVGIAQAAAALADRIAGTDFVPEAMRDNPPMVCAAIMYGDELGVGPMQALAGINVIKGKPSPSSELMRALVFRAGHSLRVIKSDGQTCRVVGQRRGDREPTMIEWTIEMARAAGLLDSNPTWRRYPRAMLLARATTELCRVMFPDVVKGLSHVVDDDGVAEGFDAWAATETGTATEPERRTQTVTRKPTVKSRPVHDVALPEPPPPDAMSAPERLDEWPVGTDQPPLPYDSPDDHTTPPDGAPPPIGSEPPADAPPSGAPEPLPDADDVEPFRDDEPQGDRTLAIMHMLFNDVGVGKDERNKRLAITSTIVRRPIKTSRELTRREALNVVRVLNDAAVHLVSIEPDPREPWGIAIQPTREDDAP